MRAIVCSISGHMTYRMFTACLVLYLVLICSDIDFKNMCLHSTTIYSSHKALVSVTLLLGRRLDKGERGLEDLKGYWTKPYIITCNCFSFKIPQFPHIMRCSQPPREHISYTPSQRDFQRWNLEVLSLRRPPIVWSWNLSELYPQMSMEEWHDITHVEWTQTSYEYE